MAALTKTVGVFPKEHAVADRVHAKGSYALGPYLVFKLIPKIPIGAAFPLMFGVVLYLMASLHPFLSCTNMNLEIGRDRSTQESINPWSNDEVLSLLLRIRSSMENWFPEFTNWEHGSRRLEELGFKRSAEKCKEKFKEESRYFNNIYQVSPMKF